jgi:hypothetical protein
MNDAKGYKRVRFEEAWAAYCPGQFSSQADLDVSIRRSVVTPMKSAQVHDFRSVAEPSGDGSKNSNLSYSHAGSDASTDRNGGNGAKGQIDQDAPRRCDHCGHPGRASDPLNGWDWPGRPAGILLHQRCEAPWFDSGGAVTADNGVSR